MGIAVLAIFLLLMVPSTLLTMVLLAKSTPSVDTEVLQYCMRLSYWESELTMGNPDAAWWINVQLPKEAKYVYRKRLFRS